MADCFLIQLGAAVAYSRLDLGAPTAAVHAAASDQLFLGDATGFAEFAISTVPAPYVWRSKDFLHARPENFSVGVVDALGVGTVRVFADGVLRSDAPFNGLTYFRLPSGPSAYRWSVELLGSAVVRGVDLAQSFAQLKGV